MSNQSYKAKIQPGRDEGEFICVVNTSNDVDMSDSAINVKCRNGETRTIRLGPRIWSGDNPRGKGINALYPFFFIKSIENRQGGDDF